MSVLVVVNNNVLILMEAITVHVGMHLVYKTIASHVKVFLLVQ